MVVPNWRLQPSRKQKSHLSGADGFTILETLTVVAIVAILMSVAVPSWLRFLDTQRLLAAQSVVYRGMQQAQGKAQQNHTDWQFSIREISEVVEWSVHSEAALPDDMNWQALGHTSVQIDLETTLQQSGSSRTIRFDQKGNISSRLGRVTLSSKRFGSVKRCVYASTIIGAFRQSKEQSVPHDGDFCY